MPITRRQLRGTAARTLVERSRNAQLTYAPVGISLGWQPVPHGYRDVQTERVVGHGEEAFHKIGYALMHWEINREAGFYVSSQHAAVREGERVGVVMPFLGLLGVSAICEVVAVVAEGDRLGFAYGTLPKHPEQGEESFMLAHQPDDSVLMTVRAVSRPAVWYVKAAGPLAHSMQSRATDKYLKAAARIGAAPAPAHAEP
ncbi:MAG: hypothetical protein QG597_4488 [Actinomycetota bacterium]|nr:hypothetical protein [Actinomycetota bacterium]